MTPLGPFHRRKASGLNLGPHSAIISIFGFAPASALRRDAGFVCPKWQYAVWSQIQQASVLAFEGQGRNSGSPTLVRALESEIRLPSPRIYKWCGPWHKPAAFHHWNECGIKKQIKKQKRHWYLSFAAYVSLCEAVFIGMRTLMLSFDRVSIAAPSRCSLTKTELNRKPSWHGPNLYNDSCPRFSIG